VVVGGRDLSIHGAVRVVNAGTLVLGDDITIDARAAPVNLQIAAGATLHIGSRVVLDFGVRIDVARDVRISDDVRIGSFATITDAADGDPAEARPVSIGASAIVGAGVVVRCGGHVASGASVRAGTVVDAAFAVGDIAPVAPYDQHAHQSPPGPQTVDAPPSAAEPHQCGIIISDFTADDLVEALRQSDGQPLRVDASLAPFDQVVQSLASLAQPAASSLDFAFIWTRPDHSITEFGKLLRGEAVDEETLEAAVDQFAALLVRSAVSIRLMLVASWVMPPERRGFGMLDLRAGGIARSLLHMNLRLTKALESTPNIYVLDAQRWVARAAPSPIGATLWYAGKIAFGTSVLDEAARDIRAALRGYAGTARKLLVLDLDDTLWGGIVGDVGVEGIALGGHDATGEAHVEFQRRIMALARRGVALAVVSKNEESVALGAMQQHTEMLIRPDQLAAYRINWQDKAENIVQIARQLNLGLQSVVFIDDNPAERGRVRRALPEVFVPEWPVGAVHYPDALEALRCFDAPSISVEDGARTSMYVAERARVADAAMHQSIDDWLRELNMRVLITPLTRASVVRAAQLMNKTNQMNLRTRRLGDNELLAWAAMPGHEFWTFTVSDRFGESGLTGLLGLQLNADSLHVADLVLSCRVMGRRVEEAMLAFAVERARALGAQSLIVEALETAKNKPCRDLLANCALHPVDGTHNSYVWPVRHLFSGPDALRVEIRFQ